MSERRPAVRLFEAGYAVTNTRPAKIGQGTCCDGHGRVIDAVDHGLSLLGEQLLADAEWWTTHPEATTSQPQEPPQEGE